MRAVETFTEVTTLNERCGHLEKQLKGREAIEQNNLGKVQAFAEKYQFMSKMLQTMDLDFQQLQKDYRVLVQKFNQEREVNS